MTTLPVDYNLYRRAREWMALHNVTLADEDAKEIDMAKIIDHTAFGQNIILHGTRPSGRPLIFVIIPRSANFAKPEAKKLMSKLPMDGTSDIVIATHSKSQSLEGISFVVNVTHEVLGYNVLRHCLSANDYVVMRDDGIARVKYDLQIEALGQMAKIRTAVDPMVFWAELQKGDVVCATVDAEDTLKQGISAAVV